MLDNGRLERLPRRSRAGILGGLWLPAAVLVVLLLPCTPAPAQSSSSLQPRVRIETTAGEFVIELDTVRAPITAENFLRYVRDHFYDGLLMHRVIAGFVVQGGGFDTSFAQRPTRAAIANESGNGLSNQRGTVGMARGDTPHSATSQFYVNLKDNAGLDPLPSRWGYAVFGRVVEGMDVVDRIAYLPTGERNGFADTPREPVVITRATVIGEGSPAAVTAPAATESPGTGSGDAAGDGAATEPATDEPADPAVDPAS